MSDSSDGQSRIWHGRPILTVLILLALGLTAGIPQSGAIGAFVIAIAVSVIARKRGSFRDMGFRRPASWPKLLGTSLAYGLIIQLTFTLFIEPGLARLTGESMNISAFDQVRGDFVAFLILIALGLTVGGFLEELTFRGFIVGRVRWLLGSGPAATWIAVVVAAVPFGLAHLYQGITGMIATGMIGFVLGAVYVRHRFNLWYAVFTHGFINTVGILVIYLDLDRELNRALF
jgi:membrane protease YdiL (CAAX protease family)